jgi:NADPH:quinone reductase-like Zn-dependent oxidoreductase
MIAVVQDEFGSPDVLRVEEVPVPVPGPGQVLVRVRAAALNPLDWHFMRGEPLVMRLQLGMRRPKGRVRGVDVAGVVEAVGDGVTTPAVGDEVFGVCRGSLARYTVAEAAHLVAKPARLSFEQAAGMGIAGLTALQELRDLAKVKQGDRVLITGAGGGVGSFAVPLAKAMGAHVTGVCSGAKTDLVLGLGADQVIDYTREDFTGRPERFDVILDNAPSHPMRRLRRVVSSSGILIPNNGDSRNRLLGPIPRLVRFVAFGRFIGLRVKMMVAKENHEDLTTLKGYVENGVLTPLVDRVFPLTEAAAAMCLLEGGHATGKIVLTP